MEDYKYDASAPGYTITIAKEANASEIIRFLDDNYNQEETVFASLRLSSNLTEEEEKLVRDDQERFATMALRLSPCLIAVHDASRKIVGVNMMILCKSPSRSDADDPTECLFNDDLIRTTFMKEYVDFLNKIADDARLLERFPSSKAALEFYAIAVDPEHRRLGLSKDLTEAGISFAKTFPNVDLVFGVYTSMYSKKSATRAGMQSILDVDLLTYKNSDGQPIFQDTPPHNIVSIMALSV